MSTKSKVKEQRVKKVRKMKESTIHIWRFSMWF